MQLHIGIVEDDSQYAAELSSLIEQWEKQNYCRLSICIYNSYHAFMTASHNMQFDLIFLDIQLNDGNGVDLAKTIRQNGFLGDLVFLTSFQEYVFEGYNVHALNYILKPASFAAVKNCLDTVFSKFHDENYVYRFRDNVVKIPYHSIIYFNSANHQTEIYTKDARYIQAEPLRNILKHLPSQFVQCHRTTIINIQHVLQIAGRDITLSNNMVIGASSTYIEAIRAAFVAQIHKNEV